MKIKTQKKGFSLIEILLVLGIVAAIAIGAFLIYPKVNEEIRYNNISDTTIELFEYFNNLDNSIGSSGSNEIYEKMQQINDINDIMMNSGNEGTGINGFITTNDGSFLVGGKSGLKVNIMTSVFGNNGMVVLSTHLNSIENNHISKGTCFKYLSKMQKVTGLGIVSFSDASYDIKSNKELMNYCDQENHQIAIPIINLGSAI